MPSSRKIILAFMLLAGGYGLALMAGGFSGWLWPGATSQSAMVPGGGSLPVLEREAHHVASTSGSARLVPALETAPHDAFEKPPIESQPTWLAAAPTAMVTNVTTIPSTVEPRESELDPSSTTLSPRARITDVARGADGASNASSPWDRWPRWEPDSAVAAAAFQRPLLPESQAVQASFDGSSAADRSLGTDDWGRPVEPADVAGLRIHIVIDGDSLARLAGRYLDDPELGDEIYRLNRDVLDDPGLLPIGVELRIPARRVAQSRSASSSGAGDATQSKPLTRLPRVDDVSHGNDGVPRAQLLAPLPATWLPAGSSGS